MSHILSVVIALLVGAHALRAENTLILAGLFSDHMVLQRDQAVTMLRQLTVQHGDALCRRHRTDALAESTVEPA